MGNFAVNVSDQKASVDGFGMEEKKERECVYMCLYLCIVGVHLPGVVEGGVLYVSPIGICYFLLRSSSWWLWLSLSFGEIV